MIEERKKMQKLSAYYAMFEYINGFRKTMFWSKKENVVSCFKIF